jgi:hypothetical protein
MPPSELSPGLVITRHCKQVCREELPAKRMLVCLFLTGTRSRHMNIKERINARTH